MNASLPFHVPLCAPCGLCVHRTQTLVRWRGFSSRSSARYVASALGLVLGTLRLPLIVVASGSRSPGPGRTSRSRLPPPRPAASATPARAESTGASPPGCRRPRSPGPSWSRSSPTIFPSARSSPRSRPCSTGAGSTSSSGRCSGSRGSGHGSRPRRATAGCRLGDPGRRTCRRAPRRVVRGAGDRARERAHPPARYRHRPRRGRARLCRAGAV